MTHDIDLVVELKPANIPALIAAFPPPDFYVSESAMRDAIAHQGMFNVLSTADGEKIDFWILSDRPFDRERFSRRRSELILQRPILVSTPEDTILMKLRWALDSGGSQKQMTDALRVYEVRHGQLEMSYLEEWAVQLGIADSWNELKANAKVV